MLKARVVADAAPVRGDVRLSWIGALPSLIVRQAAARAGPSLERTRHRQPPVTAHLTPAARPDRDKRNENDREREKRAFLSFVEEVLWVANRSASWD